MNMMKVLFSCKRNYVNTFISTAHRLLFTAGNGIPLSTQWPFDLWRVPSFLDFDGNTFRTAVRHSKDWLRRLQFFVTRSTVRCNRHKARGNSIFYCFIPREKKKKKKKKKHGKGSFYALSRSEPTVFKISISWNLQKKGKLFSSGI